MLVSRVLSLITVDGGRADKGSSEPVSRAGPHYDGRHARAESVALHFLPVVVDLVAPGAVLVLVVVFEGQDPHASRVQPVARLLLAVAGNETSCDRFCSSHRVGGIGSVW